MAFVLVWLGSPSCKKSFYFGFALFWNVSLKCSKINCKCLIIDTSRVLFTNITPRLNAIASKKCATLTPEPTWLTFAVQFKFQFTFLSAGHCTCWFCLIEWVILVLKTGPIKIEGNILGSNLLLPPKFFLCRLQTSCGPWRLLFSKVPFYASDNNHNQIS